ncbi:unnamed protein product [Parajaminaea phylloscopi]
MPAQSSDPPKLTVHHLQKGQSERIVWLLEELQVPYNLVIHKRDPLLAPPSLKAVHPAGTAPVLVDGDLVLSESMAIATYILEKHATREQRLSLVPEQADPLWTDYLYWLYFGLNTLAPASYACMFPYFDDKVADDSLARSFPRKRFQNNLSALDKRLATSSFVAGDRFTLADVMILWTLTGQRDFLPYSLEPYPSIVRYLDAITSRPAYRRAKDKGDAGLHWMNKAVPQPHRAKF